jgi:AraC-like DNA-binding protein
MSTRNLSRLFMDELGLTPKQALSQYRVLRAQELLLAGCGVTETAYEVGYASLSQFIALFRQVTGRLPSEFVRKP